MGEAAHELDEEGLFAALFSPAGRRDPYPCYRRFRGPGVRHAVVQRLMRDGRFGPPPIVDRGSFFWDQFADWMIKLDGAGHEAMRALAAPPFGPRPVASYAPTVRRLVDRLLDTTTAQGGTFDVMTALAHPLPVTVICALLGLDDDEPPRLIAWLHEVAYALSHQTEAEGLARGDAAMRRLTDYAAQLLRDRCERPREDLLSALAADDRLPFATRVANTVFLLHAGHDTTMNAICSCLHLLLTHPEQLELVRQEPARLAGAIEEGLRLESPVQISTRVAHEDVELEGVRFARARITSVFVGAANRDPAVFAEPDRFDVTRAPNPHLAFLPGRHFCLGAPLARLELTSALGALLERFPRLRLAREPRWLSSMPLRGLDALAVST